MMHTAAETAIGPGNDILTSDDVREADDPIGDKLRMFDEIGGMTDDTRNQNLAVGQLVSFHTFHSCSCRTFPASTE